MPVSPSIITSRVCGGRANQGDPFALTGLGELAEPLCPVPVLGAADGVAGDPTRSSAEIGARRVELIVTRTVATIRTAVSTREDAVARAKTI